MLIGPDPDQVRTEHLDLVPGRRIAGRPLLLDVPGGGFQDGKKQRAPSTILHVHVCVCAVLCGNKEGMSSRFQVYRGSIVYIGGL